jgi:hypothetical protein
MPEFVKHQVSCEPTINRNDALPLEVPFSPVGLEFVITRRNSYGAAASRRAVSIRGLWNNCRKYPGVCQRGCVHRGFIGQAGRSVVRSVGRGESSRSVTSVYRTAGVGESFVKRTAWKASAPANNCRNSCVRLASGRSSNLRCESKCESMKGWRDHSRGR